MDYFGRYFTNEVFDFSGLINDDFVQPVRILFNAKHYVSATKLLMVAIDSVAYVEYGEVTERPNAFMRWLNAYAELATLDITSRELWEHRNALLHMSGLRSREVERGTVRMLVGHVGQLPDGVVLKEQATGHYNIYALIQVFGKALGRWLETYGQQRDKIEAFVERYDRIAADSRMMVIAFDDPANKPA